MLALKSSLFLTDSNFKWPGSMQDTDANELVFVSDELKRIVIFPSGTVIWTRLIMRIRDTIQKSDNPFYALDKVLLTEFCSDYNTLRIIWDGVHGNLLRRMALEQTKVTCFLVFGFIVGPSFHEGLW